MKELFLFRDSLANKISYYHLMLFLLSLPFDLFYSHLILISFSIHTVIHFNRLALKPIFVLRTLALQSIFFVTVISTVYAADKSLAFNEWGLDITIFLMPILFYINPLDLKKYGQRLLFMFALGCAATVIYLYTNAALTLRFYHLPLSLIFSPAFTNHNFAQPIGIHATFFSLQIAVALVFMLTLVIRKNNLASRLFYCFICLVLLAGIIQLSSKSIFVALFLSINIAFPLFLLKGAGRRRFFAVSASLTLLIVAGIFSSAPFRDRYLSQLQEDFSPMKPNQTIEPRLVRWEIADKLISESPVIGHGAGSEIPLLQEKYFEKKFYNSYLNRLNAHNEYLSLLIKSGIWGLAVYLVTLVFGFRIAFGEKNIVFLTVMVLIAVVSLSENILDADKGVMFYSFFLPFFVFVSERKEKIPIPIKRYKNLRNVATKRIPATSSL